MSPRDKLLATSEYHPLRENPFQISVENVLRKQVGEQFKWTAFKSREIKAMGRT